MLYCKKQMRIREVWHDKTGRDTKVERGEGCSDPGTLLCASWGTGDCGLYRGFLFPEQKGGRSAAAHDCVLRGVLYGGECQAAESVQNSADARCRGRLSDGPYGREGDHREGARAVWRFGSGMLYQFDRQNQVMVWCQRDLCKCGSDCPQSAQSAHFIYTGQKSCAFCGRTGSWEAVCF